MEPNEDHDQDVEDSLESKSKRGIYEEVVSMQELGKILGFHVENNDLVVEALAQGLKAKNDDLYKSKLSKGRGRKKHSKKEHQNRLAMFFCCVMHELGL